VVFLRRTPQAATEGLRQWFLELESLAMGLNFLDTPVVKTDSHSFQLCCDGTVVNRVTNPKE
jgi:hypothetical protein